MKFNELSEQERIQFIKDGFVLILEQLVKDPTKVKTYIKPLERPKPIQPILERATESMSGEQKKLVEDRNKLAEEKAKIETEKLEIDFKQREEQIQKTQDLVTKLEKKEGCLCGSCINLNVTSSLIPPEFEALIDVARQEAEAKSY